MSSGNFDKFSFAFKMAWLVIVTQPNYFSLPKYFTQKSRNQIFRLKLIIQLRNKIRISWVKFILFSIPKPFKLLNLKNYIKVSFVWNSILERSVNLFIYKFSASNHSGNFPFTTFIKNVFVRICILHRTNKFFLPWRQQNVFYSYPT